MIDRLAFLAHAQKLVARLEKDLRARCDDMPEVGQAVGEEYRRAKGAGRTGQTLEEWRADAITQQAVAWVLSCVFVRFLEDNTLIDPPILAGPGDRLNRARDEHELFFQAHPEQTDREYLLAVFDDLSKRNGTKDLYGTHNPIRAIPNWLSPDAAKDILLPFFQRIDAGTGKLVWDFTQKEEDLPQSRKVAKNEEEKRSSSRPGDLATLRETASFDTRFLGDLYQDLSEAARKKYALLQTPVFVEEFILERTLEPAIETFGLDKVRMIDPACGSGHFLLGGFHRLLAHWQKKEPGTPRRELVQRTLNAVHGVDLNPYAVAIARFRLLVAAWEAAGVTSLRNAPDFKLNLACGDSLLHGGRAMQTTLDDTIFGHHYQPEDPITLERLLRSGTYHAVVANPPYITPKDKRLNEQYRERYSVCHMQYSLAVPFMQRIFDLACDGGFTGQITANSFMKREFGKKLIQEFVPRVDMTHVVDTSGAYIPGHGTPTVILFGQNRLPVAATIRTVMGISGEPSAPDDPSNGQVWTAIVHQIDQPGSQSTFVSVADLMRETFYKHPWNIGGGGVTDIKNLIDFNCIEILNRHISDIGRTCVVGHDDCWIMEKSELARLRLSHHGMRFVIGECLEDWSCFTTLSVLYPYDCLGGVPISPEDRAVAQHLWFFRSLLRSRTVFGRSLDDQGRPWYEYLEHYRSRFAQPRSIVSKEISTHVTFVLDQGDTVFKHSAPVIKLPATATEDDHLALLGLLNSSTACFWLKQVCHNKGSTVDQNHARQRTAPFEDFYAFNSTKVGQFPLPAERPLRIAQALDARAQLLEGFAPSYVLATQLDIDAETLFAAKVGWHVCRNQMVMLQEELDWECYRLYGLLADDLTIADDPFPIQLGERAFEIVLARKMRDEGLHTTWFVRHHSTPITDPPAHWPADYRELVERRIAAIGNNPQIALIEQPEYKRRWNDTPWDEKVTAALHNWLLDRLEAYFDFDGRMQDLPPSRKDAKNTAETSSSPLGDFAALREISLYPLSKVADVAAKDSAFQTVAGLYRGRADFDVTKLVAELVEAESVPALPVLRYKPTGLDKRRAWERTWELQRREDVIDARATRKGGGINDDGWTLQTDDGTSPLNAGQAKLLKQYLIDPDNPQAIPVPPKYKSADFQKADYWRLRGSLDVPKERWVSFPHCEGADALPLVAWAGYDHLQLARAIAAHYVHVQEQEGGRGDPRLVPLLAALAELIPWLKQWHNEVDKEFGYRMGDYYEGFVQDEAREMGKTVDEVRAWQPPAKATRGRRRNVQG